MGGPERTKENKELGRYREVRGDDNNGIITAGREGQGGVGRVGCCREGINRGVLAGKNMGPGSTSPIFGRGQPPSPYHTLPESPAPSQVNSQR